MFHYTFFGGSEGEIAPRDFSSVTVFGGCSLRRPTLAQRLMHLKRGPSPRPRGFFRRLLYSDQSIILTLFGGTEIAEPTLMEEYTALRNLVSSGAVSPTECRQLLERLTSGDAPENWVTITMFGACVRKQLDARRQEKALEAGERAGLISAEHRHTLKELIGAPPATAAEVLGRLAV